MTDTPDAIIHCDKCGGVFAVVLPKDPEDVFFKVQREMGRTVCPDCLQAARGIQYYPCKCGKEGRAPHTCPWKSELSKGDEVCTQCLCCERCTTECARDV